MKPPPFEYACPTSLDEAVELLALGDSRPLAGGQSLIPLLNFRLARPSVLVDLRRIPELRECRVNGAGIEVGAMVTFSDARNEAALEGLGLLRKALPHIGHVQIQSRGTIGGSIAHADPAAELPAVALSLDAQIGALSRNGPRTIAAADFFLGPYSTALADGELLTHVRFPASESARSSVVEFSRRHGDFAIVGVAASIDTAEDGATVQRARISAFGMGATAQRLANAEEALRGELLTSASVVDRSASAAAQEVDPFDDANASARYRRHLVEGLTRRALMEVSGVAQR